VFLAAVKNELKLRCF